MMFALWIQDCLLSKKASDNLLLGYHLLSDNFPEDLMSQVFEGKMYAINICDEVVSFSSSLNGCHSYQYGWGWQCDSLEVDISRSVLTNQESFSLIFSGPVEVQPNPEKLSRYPRRGKLTVPVASADGWVGVLDYTSSGIFKQKITWKLHAYSACNNTKVKCGPLVVPVNGWFPLNSENSKPYGELTATSPCYQKTHPDSKTF